MLNGIRRRALGAVLAAVMLLAGCSGSQTDEVPIPALDGVDPLIAERIREVAETVVREPESAAAWGRLGVVYELNGFREEGLRCYAKARELDPEDWRWSYFAGLALREVEPAQARDLLALAARSAQGYPPIDFHLGVLAIAARDLDSAVTHFEAALSGDPELVDGLLGLAHVAVARDDPEAALELIDRATVLAPQEAAVHFHRAEAFRLLERADDAARAERVGRSSPVPARADGFATLPDPVRDEATLRDGLTVDWLIRNSRTHLDAGRGDRGIEALRLAVQSEPDSVDLRLDLSRGLMQVGAFEPAGQEAERALALDGSRADSYLQMADVLTRVGQFERAAQALQRALEIDESYHEARGALGTILTETGQVDQGLALLFEASQQLPGNVEVRYNLAAALLRAGRPAEAMDIAVAVVRDRPDFAPAHVLVGSMYAMNGQLEESVTALTRALEVSPNDVDARLELGRSLWELERYKEAVQSFAAASAGRPNDPEIARELAWAMATAPDEEARNGEQALALAKRLCESSRNQNPMHLDVLAAAQAATGSYAEADETAGQALKIVETTLAGVPAEETGKRRVLSELAEQLRRRQALYRSGKS